MEGVTLGAQGERVAEAYLRSRGYQVLSRNWKVMNRNGRQVGELDIVAKSPEGALAIVEVKAGRAKDRAWRPEVHMTDEKIHKLSRAAEAWLARHGGKDQAWQIDLIAVDFSKNPPHVRHYCHAPIV